MPDVLDGFPRTSIFATAAFRLRPAPAGLQHGAQVTLIRLSSMEVLDQLAEIDLLPKALANRAAETITDERRTNDIR